MGDIDALKAEINELRRLVESLTESTRRHDEDIRQLFAAHEATKVYVNQILNKIDQLETKLFSLVTQLTTVQKDERKEESKERTANQKMFIEAIKWIISSTLVALITYIFAKGGM